MPFAAKSSGLHDFYNDKSKDGSLTLRMATPLRFRYRRVPPPRGCRGGRPCQRIQEILGNEVTRLSILDKPDSSKLAKGVVPWRLIAWVILLAALLSP